MTLTACLSLWLLSVATALGYFDAPINFAWTAIKGAGTRTVAKWGRATKRHAVSLPPADGPISRRGTSESTEAACTVVATCNALGAEFDEVTFYWPEAVCR